MNTDKYTINDSKALVEDSILSNWLKAFHCNEFFVFAYEDESREHFARSFIKDRRTNAFSDKETKQFSHPDINTSKYEIDDLSAPAVIRYSLVLDWVPTTSNRNIDPIINRITRSNTIDPIVNDYDNVANRGEINIVSESILFSNSSIGTKAVSAEDNFRFDLDEYVNSRMNIPWISSSSIGYIRNCKRVSPIHAMIQILTYQQAVVGNLSHAVERLLSSSKKDLQNLILFKSDDDITHPEGILVSSIVFLSNFFLQPGTTCVGLHNAENVVSFIVSVIIKLYRSLFAICTYR